MNLSKSDFGKAAVIYLGHVVGQGKISPIEAKVQRIAKFVPPNDRKSLRRFLGMAGFYRKFCRNFADVAMPLTNLLKKQTPFNWTNKCQASFDGIKAMLMSSPVLAAPNFEIPFKLAIDASDLGMGAVLIQENSEGVDIPQLKRRLWPSYVLLIILRCMSADTATRRWFIRTITR